MSDVERLSLAGDGREQKVGLEWVQDQGLQTEREGACVANCGDRVYVIGGMDSELRDLDMVESAGPGLDWRVESPLPVAASFSTVKPKPYEP
jgi:hypothetical protein